MQRQLNVSLSRLVPTKRDIRRVKPVREAHRRLVASIRSHGLIEPLVVRVAADCNRYLVIAGNRRLRALREVHRGEDPKIPCVLRDAEDGEVEAVSLAENFVREPMHPLDEAEVFARLAGDEGKDAPAIAAHFGTPEKYVKQRMRLATLAPVVKAAYREGTIDTATAEAFAAVPEDRQCAVWAEVNGHPRHAEHVRNVIAGEWVDATHALFDPSTLPAEAVSRDLFGERVLVERQAFREAQSKAVDAERTALVESGWSAVVVANREDVYDRLTSMDEPDPEFDAATSRRLQAIERRWERAEASIAKIAEDDRDAFNALQQKLHALDAEAEAIRDAAPKHFSDETKAVATVFLVLDADGKVNREYRVPRRRAEPQTRVNGATDTNGDVPNGRPKPITSDDLSDRQRADAFTHRTLAVREALLDNASARKRVLALLLHDKVRSEALAVRPEPKGVTLHAASDGFTSAVGDRLRAKRAKLDPFAADHFVDDRAAYERLAKLSPAKLDALIDLLVVELVTSHPLRETELVAALADELNVNVRTDWRPDAGWLAGYQKAQLAHLLIELKGPVHAPSPERKKSELVGALAALFADAAEGRIVDVALAERVNRWRPSNLRRTTDMAA